MHPSSSLSHAAPAPGFPRVGASIIALALVCCGVTMLARTMPDIIQRIGRPCAGCYLGAFGPPLEPYGRPTGQRREISTAVGALPSTQTPSPAGGGDLHWLSLNEAVGRMSSAFHSGGGEMETAWTPGRPGPHTEGASPRQDGAAMWDFSLSLSGPGLTNFPRELPWASRPGKPRDGAAWITAPNRDAPDAAGDIAAVRTVSMRGTVPYWRVALRKDLERHFLQIGTYALRDGGLNDGGIGMGGTGAGEASGASPPRGTTAVFAGIGAETNYQFTIDRGAPVSDILSAHAAISHEARSLDARYRVPGGSELDSLDTFLADASWSVGDAVTSSIQYFRTAGATGIGQYVWPGALRNSAGVIAGVAYAPWGGSESPVQLLNLRFAAQYVAYTEFNGATRGAGANNGLFLSLWGALRF